MEKNKYYEKIIFDFEIKLYSSMYKSITHNVSGTEGEIIQVYDDLYEYIIDTRTEKYFFDDLP